MKVETTPMEAGMMLVVTRQDVEALKTQRALLKKFIESELVEAQFKDQSSEDYGQGDYGIIPGTKRKTLLKPGAEKFLRIFNLGFRMHQIDKQIDRDANFAMYTYSAEVFDLKRGTTIAECDGCTNSQETKYKERTVWKTTGKDKKGALIRESMKEEVPIFDILNTLMKMAQKRALVGATLIATMASDYFDHDIESAAEAEAIGKKARVEKEVTAEPVDEASPVCCGKSMMISKYRDKNSGEYPWYCVKCQSKQFRGE